VARRTKRINHLLREEISELIHRQVKDPRLGGFITVTQVATSVDLRHARVFISVMGSEAEKQEVLQTLVGAAGFFHRELKTRLALYRIPELSFHRDETIEQGAYILQRIDQVVGSDSEENLGQGEH